MSIRADAGARWAGSQPERRRLIARLLGERDVSSQHELVGLLAAAGFPATQATVSRDLDEMGAVKLRRNGRVVYALAGTPPGAVPGPGGEALRRLLADSVGDVESSGNLVVVHTPPGYAAMVASAIDRAALEGIAGTVAGDDTILVVCRQGVAARGVEDRLRETAGLGRPSKDGTGRAGKDGAGRPAASRSGRSRVRNPPGTNGGVR
ncbi:MAG: arginine repressor [Actinomycetota bacterium]